ncbi:MAG: DUF6786 family protein [Opitutae bacterium]
MRNLIPAHPARPVRAVILACLSLMTPLVPIRAAAGTFGDDVAFLQRYTDLVVLREPGEGAQVALAPAWQGRVMTSTAGGAAGASFGWINRELIAAGKLQPHINVFGGEDRFWLGPEGGQFSIFFAPGAKFELPDWFTPAPLDTMPYQLRQKSDNQARFGAKFALTNYRGSTFEVEVSREVRLLPARQAWEKLGVASMPGVSLVAYESANTITNAGTVPWRKESGLLSIWILGMFNPTAVTTIVVPLRPGPESELGVPVTSDYFGRVPPERLVVRPGVLFFSGDGQFRSKIGVSPRRSTGVLGSYDAVHRVLTIVQFTRPAGATDYVNSLWKLQDNPYAGDAANSYNDGPPTPGAKPLGPFYELESSSPAAALAPGQSLTHVHRTMHLSGEEKDLDRVARAVLGVSLDEIKSALKTSAQFPPPAVQSSD